MADGRHFQEWLRDAFAGCGREEMPFRYLVWGSRAPGAWSMGGDLGTFTRLIREPGRGRACAPTPTAPSTCSTTIIAGSTCRS